MEPENSSEDSSEKRSATVRSDTIRSETIKFSEKAPRAMVPLSPLTEARLALKHLERREWRAGRLADLLRNLVEMLEIRERLDSASERQVWELSASGEFLFDSDTASKILRPLPKTLDEFLERITDSTERDAVTAWFREIRNATSDQMYRKVFLFHGEAIRFLALFSDFSGGVRRLVGVMERIDDDIL